MDLPTQNLYNLPKNTNFTKILILTSWHAAQVDTCSGMIMQFIPNFFNEPLVNIEVNLRIDRD